MDMSKTWGSARFAGMGFLPYLPQDNSGLEDTAGEATVEAISADLGRLLRTPAREFWATVHRDASLATCLDSYLQYTRCGALAAMHRSACATAGPSIWYFACVDLLLPSV